MNFKYILEVQCDWRGKLFENSLELIIQALESGKVIYIPKLSFFIDENEKFLLDAKWAHPKIKNMSLRPNGLLKGFHSNALDSCKKNKSSLHPVTKHMMQNFISKDKAVETCFIDLINRFTQFSSSLIEGLLPAYRNYLTMAPTSLRLHRTETRSSSWRSDDSRLHVDAFPSRPTGDKRILRVFANINPNQEARVWRLGEPFECIAKRFISQISPYHVFWAKLLKWLGATRTLRTPYDDIMLKIHDAMKADDCYQQECEQIIMPFAAGSVWICFSDQVAHAASSGQFMFEQSFFINTRNMVAAENSPLNILERLTQKKLL